jgi:L-ascorbate metabolism protein UlaG (beta-lactamase superfamily)
MIENIKWLGYSSFVIEGPPLIYIDPWRVVRKAFHPDVILVSHDHYDHCSPADINKLRGPDTRIIGSESVAQQIDGCQIIRPWQSITVDRAGIKAVPAYSPDDMRHPVEAGGIGFVISLNLYDIYYAGDTQIIPEMAHIQPDIAILPIDGNGTLNVSDAVEVVRMIEPHWVIPANWGTGADGASVVDAKDFREAVGDMAEVILLEPIR